MSKQRRIFAVSAVAMLTGMAIAAACSFPEPQLIGGDGDGDGSVTPDVTADTADGNDDSGPDGGKPIDDSGPPPVDANGERPGDVDANCLCDCDGDRFRTNSQDAAACEAGIQPDDCDDLDHRANPDSGWVSDQPTKETQGNWDCDDQQTVTAEYGGNLNCGAVNLSVPCSQRKGFIGNPGCGEEGDFAQCEAQGLGCGAGPPVKKTRACK